METNTKENILRKARRLIHKNGFRATSMDAIAKAAGVKKANIFYYFPTKEALGLELLDWVANEALDHVCVPPLIEDRHPRDQVRDYLGRIRAVMEKNSTVGGCPLGNLALEMADVDEEFRSRLSSFFEAWAEGIERVLKFGMEQGVYRETLDPRGMAAFIVSSYEGAILMAKTKRDTQALADAESQLLILLESYER